MRGGLVTKFAFPSSNLSDTSRVTCVLSHTKAFKPSIFADFSDELASVIDQESRIFKMAEDPLTSCRRISIGSAREPILNER